MSTGTILDEIIEHKRLELNEAMKLLPEPSIKELALGSPMPGDFASAIDPARGLRIIAEIKHASPSKGVFRDDFDPVSIARSYERGGASALSVLTDRKFFRGDLSYLVDIKREVDIPLLRKDFIIDPYQVYESRLCGADAILLIVASLEDALLRDLIWLSDSLGLSAIVEVHDEAELKRAIDAGSGIIGINNRDLKTFQVDLGVSGRLAGMIPGGVTAIAESGISSGDDIRKLMAAGIHVFLIGEAFMTAPDPGLELKTLITHARRVRHPT